MRRRKSGDYSNAGLGQKPTLDAAELRELDAAIDECFSGVYKTLEVQAALKRSSHAASTRRVLDAAFPGGLRVRAHAPWTEKAYLNERTLKALQAPEHEPELKRLGQVELLGEVAPKVERFAVAMGAKQPVTGAVVAEAEALSEQATLFVVFKTLGAFDWTRPAEVEKRDKLLLPLRSAHEELHRVYTARSRAKAKAVCDTPVKAQVEAESTSTDQAANDAAGASGAAGGQGGAEVAREADPSTAATEPFPAAPETITPVNNPGLPGLVASS